MINKSQQILIFWDGGSISMPNPSAVPKMKPSGAIFAPQDELPIAKKDSPPAVLPTSRQSLFVARKKIKRGPMWRGGSVLGLNFRNSWRKKRILLPKVFSQLPKLSFWDFIF